MQRTSICAASAIAVVWSAAISQAGAATPAPSIAFGGLTTIYIGTGVHDDNGFNTGTATVFHCTNVSGVSAQVRFLVLNSTGGVAASHAATVAHGVTYTVATTATFTYAEHHNLDMGAVSGGMVNIEATQSGVFCNAKVIDAAAAFPDGLALPLVRVNPHPGMTVASAPAPSPATVFSDLRTIYAGTGVRDGGDLIEAGAATVFQCTNVSGVSERVRFAVLSVAGNFIEGETTVTVPHGRTWTASTHFTVAYNEQSNLNTGIVNEGLVIIEATNSAIFCSAKTVNAGAPVPDGVILDLVRLNQHPGTLE